MRKGNNLMGNTYAKLTERNEWEGETWYFWIPIEGNEDSLDSLGKAIDHIDDESEKTTFELDLTPVPESEVDILIKHEEGDNTTYMDAHNKIAGKLVLPEEALAQLTAGEIQPLNKGGIRDFCKV